MDPFVLAVLGGLLFSPLYHICFRPLEYFNRGLRFPVTALCFLQTVSIFSKENDLALWFLSLLQCMVIWTLVDNFATHHLPSFLIHDDKQLDDNKDEMGFSTSILNGAVWIKTHMMLCYTHPFIIFVTCLHLLDALFIWNPQLTYTKNNYDLIGTLYNVVHIIMFITLSWRKHVTATQQSKQRLEIESEKATGVSTISRAFFVYHFLVGLQPTRSIIRTITTFPYRPSGIPWQESSLYLLSSALATIDTLPALILCYYNISSETELISFIKGYCYKESSSTNDDNDKIENERHDDDHDDHDDHDEKNESRMLMTVPISAREVPVRDPNVLAEYVTTKSYY